VTVTDVNIANIAILRIMASVKVVINSRITVYASQSTKELRLQDETNAEKYETLMQH
jgi:hypothetical protein